MGHVSSPTRNYGANSPDTTYASEFGSISIAVDFGDGTLTKSLTAPCEGYLIAARMQTQTTTGATNKITLALTNESNSSADMIPSKLYDDDPVATTNTAVDLVLGTFAAVQVNEGDALELAYTEAGTIAGLGVTLYFVSN